MGPVSFLGVCALWVGYLLSNFLGRFSEYMFLGGGDIVSLISNVVAGGLIIVLLLQLTKKLNRIRGYWFVEWFVESI